jgi:hypothetical protein
VVWRGGVGWHWRGCRTIRDPPHEQAREAGAGGGVVWCCGVSPVPCPPSSSRPVLPLSFVVRCLLFFVCCCSLLLSAILGHSPLVIFVLGRCGLYRMAFAAVIGMGVGVAVACLRRRRCSTCDRPNEQLLVGAGGGWYVMRCSSPWGLITLSAPTYPPCEQWLAAAGIGAVVDVHWLGMGCLVSSSLHVNVSNQHMTHITLPQTQ